jgi:hypothetical protein
VVVRIFVIVKNKHQKRSKQTHHKGTYGCSSKRACYAFYWPLGNGLKGLGRPLTISRQYRAKTLWKGVDFFSEIPRTFGRWPESFYTYQGPLPTEPQQKYIYNFY